MAEPTIPTEPKLPEEPKQINDLNIDLDTDAIKSIDKENIKNLLVNFIVPLISLVIILVLIIAVIVPTYSKLPELKQELDTKNTKKGVLETKIGVLNRLTDFETVVEEDTELFKQALVDEPMVPELLTQIDTIARESGLTVTKLSNSLSEAGPASSTADATSPDYSSVMVTLGVTGTYDQIVLFNENLEGATRLVEVDDLRFSSESNEDTEEYSATFVLKSPYLSIKSEAVTDEPITVDISSPEFLAVVGKIKSMKHYDITVQDYILENLAKQEQEEADAEAEAAEEEDAEADTDTDTDTADTPEEEVIVIEETPGETGVENTEDSEVFIDDQSGN